jgi:hypothetical protein
MFLKFALKRSISGQGKQPSENFVFFPCKQNLCSHFFDLDIKNPLGGSNLAKIRILPEYYIEKGTQLPVISICTIKH